MQGCDWSVAQMQGCDWAVIGQWHRQGEGPLIRSGISEPQSVLSLVMEKQVPLLLLLLLWPVLAAHIPDQESQDLHTVLRDLRAALAEHQVKIELLQTLNQGQTSHTPGETR
uniref:Uncharacterized protein n=1 Tax=Knipowitschia caucasica TaxID=637954 RepID=A0AAV2LW06_KNICA